LDSLIGWLALVEGCPAKGLQHVLGDGGKETDTLAFRINQRIKDEDKNGVRIPLLNS